MGPAQAQPLRSSRTELWRCEIALPPSFTSRLTVASSINGSGSMDASFREAYLLARWPRHPMRQDKQNIGYIIWNLEEKASNWSKNMVRGQWQKRSHKFRPDGRLSFEGLLRLEVGEGGWGTETEPTSSIRTGGWRRPTQESAHSYTIGGPLHSSQAKI